MTAAVNNKLITSTYCSSKQPTKIVIGLHGWTGNEHMFEPVAKMIKVHDTKWVFPRAPYVADTGKGYTWFSGNDEKGWEEFVPEEIAKTINEKCLFGHPCKHIIK